MEYSSIEECLDYCNTKQILSVDTETEGFDPFTKNLLLFQIGDYDNQFIIDCTTINILFIKPILENKDKLKILQNAQFDLRFFYHLGIDIQNIYDTLLVECIITGGYSDEKDKKEVSDLLGKEIAIKYIDREIALDKLTLKYCNIKLDKSIRGIIHKEQMSTRVLQYSADDVKYLPIIRKKQLGIINSYIEKYGIDGGVVDLENEVVRVFSKMIYNGIKIDPIKYRKEVISIVKDNIKETTLELDKIVLNEPKLSKYHFYQANIFNQDRFTEINWNSSAQKLDILQLLDPKVENTASNTIRKKIKHPIGNHLLEYNINKKLEASFGESLLGFINPVTKRIHPQIWQILSTGRISMNNPNLLQIPSKGKLGKTIRSCFIPEEGNKLVGGDYSGFELAIIAEFSQDPLWIKVLNEGGDLHSELCSQTFNIPIENVKNTFPYNKELTYRDVQKTIDFGLAYGMSEFKLSNTIGVSKDQALEIINNFFSKVPKVKAFLDTLGELSKKRGYIKIKNPNGRIRFFPKYNVIKDFPEATNDIAFKWLGEIERAGKNSPIQGCNGNVIKKALIYTQNKIDKYKYPAKILLSIYDELLTECEESFAEEWKTILENQMLKAGKEVIKTVPLKAECKISDFWLK